MSSVFNRVAVCIPAYKPLEKELLTLIHELREQGLHNIVVVNNGNHSDFDGLFQQVADLGCEVIGVEINEGKGKGLKAAFQHCLQNHAELQGVVTCDADNQHRAADVARVASASIDNPQSLALGVRDFSFSAMPLRSWFGNSLTRLVYLLFTWQAIRDSQTGLRGIPLCHLPALVDIPAQGYEFELHALLYMRTLKVPVLQIPIETIYIDNNNSSHFHPIWDSLRIYRTFLSHLLKRR